MTTVLIVDEAHHLSAELLEEIRLLSNLETTNDKLLQIVLVGQPELDDKLDSFELRQLKQRIAVRTRLLPLGPRETRVYIERRLQIAGADPNSTPIFPEQAIQAVYRYSRGLPRLINSICENALIAAYARQSPYVTPDVIEYVVEELRLNIPYPPAADNIKRHSDADVQRAIDTLLDLYTSRRGPFANDLSLGIPPRVEERTS